MKHAFLVITLLLCASCASAPPVGVRAPFQNTKITHVSVVDFYATSNFGLGEEELDATIALYEMAAVAWLQSTGTTVTTPDALQERLTQRGLDVAFQDGVLLERSLSELFEPEEESLPLESQTVKALAGQGAFPSNALLFGEVVYQTEGICEGDVREFTEHAVVLEPVGSSSAPSPCYVSHIDAKLVDTASGATMWHNRLLVEQWFEESDEGLREATIVRVVEMVLEGDEGIGPLLVTTPSS